MIKICSVGLVLVGLLQLGLDEKLLGYGFIASGVVCFIADVAADLWVQSKL